MLLKAAETAQGLRLLCHEGNPNLCPREPPEWEPVENPARETLQIHKRQYPGAGKRSQGILLLCVVFVALVRPV